jgi:cell division protein FtsX
MAIAVSYLLIISRKPEFAIIRGLGANRLFTFLTFFVEQSVLCLLGIAIGLIGWWLLIAEPTSYHLALILGFVACFSLGCAISILMMNSSKVLTILLDRD